MQTSVHQIRNQTIGIIRVFLLVNLRLFKLTPFTSALEYFIYVGMQMIVMGESLAYDLLFGYCVGENHRHGTQHFIVKSKNT